MKICVSILPKTVTETLALVEKAEDCQADFIEVRLDNLKDLSRLTDITKSVKTPLIATKKPSNCQNRSVNEAERQKVLLVAARSGFEYVDVELSTPKMSGFANELMEIGIKKIISFHGLVGAINISRMHEILEEEIASGADVCKIVVRAKTVEDNLAALNFTSEASRKAKLVCFCMGPLGKPSRLLSPLFGAFFTFASLEEGKETAVGQMTIQEMRSTYRVLGLM